MSNVFTPLRDPARRIYMAFQKEAAKRFARPHEEWVEAERKAVWREARDYAQEHGLPVLTMKQIEAAESCALGHSDYGAKWAYGVTELLIGAGHGNG